MDRKSIVAEVARKLGGVEVLGVSVQSQVDLAMIVQNRLPLASLQSAVSAGLSEREIEHFIIPQRTRRHRAERKERLTVDESDRAVRLVRMQSLAEETFSDIEHARRWLRKPLAELAGETPLTLAHTESGARVIETILAKIAWGAAV